MKEKFTLLYFINNLESKKFQIEDLQRFENEIHKEEDNFLKEILEKQEDDFFIDENFDEFDDVFEMLNETKLKPQNKSVQNIMNFAKYYQIIPLKSIDDMELILN